MLLLGVLSVFAVKSLGDLASKEKAFATDEHGKKGKQPFRHFRECGNPY